MKTNIAGVRRAAYEMPWMLQLAKLDAVLDFIDARAGGAELPAEWTEAERRQYEPQQAGSVMILPLTGVMSRRVNMMQRMSGGTSTEVYGQWFDDAVADPAVTAIVLLIDSPGGSVYGTPELARKVFAARGTKPIIAVADSLAASAGFYVFAAAPVRVITPSGEVGSLGVYMAHDDISAMAAMAGVKRTYIHAGTYKVELNQFQPLPDDAKAYLQAQVDDMYRMFVDDVALFFGIRAADVEANFGQGRCLLAARALDAGMCDRVATLDEVVAELTAEDEKPAVESEPDLPIGIPLAPADGGDDDEDRALEVGAETRAVEGGVGAEAEQLVGVAVRFGSPSAELRTPSGSVFREEFEEGAFADSLTQDDIRVQWQHDPKYVFGRCSAGTARVWEEAGDGLHYTADPPDAQWARDAMASVRRGDVSQNSFTFRVLAGGERWERRAGVLHRVITRARLFEVGPQTQPAYPDTSVVVRSMEAFVAAEHLPDDAPPPAPEMDLLRRRARLAQLRS